MSKQRMMKGADVLAGGVSFIGQFLKVSRGLAGVAALAAAAVPAAAEYRFAEGFNELTLGPSVSPTEFNGFGPAAWTPTPPTGWTLDNSGMPQTGVAPEEFYGFTFLNKDFWVQTAGNQERDTFARGRGVVMVADSDEFDDGTDVDGADPNFNLFNTFITTPEIDLTGVGANQALLNFDSSFRPFPDMTGRVEVSYDGGTTFSEVLLLQTDENTFPASSLDRANEHVSISLNNPANGSVQARFSMVDAGNDWWWAVDNVSVTVGGE
ncbi:MAG: hypothetical protein MI741_17675, partial [Rhodospirillales bacterium]|nr:hypothetical protein [Rhodospirillales bacterium]